FLHLLIFPLSSRQVDEPALPFLRPLQRVGALAGTRAAEYQHALFGRLCAWHTTSLRVKSDKLRVKNYAQGVKSRRLPALPFSLFIPRSLFMPRRGAGCHGYVGRSAESRHWQPERRGTRRAAG